MNYGSLKLFSMNFPSNRAVPTDGKWYDKIKFDISGVTPTGDYELVLRWYGHAKPVNDIKIDES